MIRLPKLYVKRKDIPIQSLFDLASSDTRDKAAGIYTPDGKPEVDNLIRSTTIKVGPTPEDFPDICKHLLDMINIWDGTLDPNDYVVKEFNYLKYGKGDKFTRHRDQIKKKGKAFRIFSTSTIIKVSDDLEGGHFRMWDHLHTQVDVHIDVGETLFFDSRTPHEITEVMQGEREVLVAWIYKK